MQELYIKAEGELVDPHDLKVKKARELANLMIVNSLPYIYLLETRRKEDGNEIIVFETEVELGQRLVHDIHQLERISVEFPYNDDRFPEVLALRIDFPVVPHLNLRSNDIPRSLCLYEIDYTEYQLRWTSITFVERIREWLALTAKDKLHSIDQPLEPFFISSHNIIIPNELLRDDLGNQPLLFEITALDKEFRFLECNTHSRRNKSVPFIGYILRGEPQEHGIIYKQPQNLQDLHTIITRANIDLVNNLRTTLKKWLQDKPFQDIFDCKLLLITILPKTRKTGTSVEITDVWAFICPDTIKQIGIDLSVWQVIDGVPGIIFEESIPKAENVKLSVVRPVLSFSKDLANTLSGIDKKDINIVLIGAGALGSQIHLNLARMGYGNWTLVDNDYLFPHNMARHGLPSVFIGENKAIALQQYVSILLNDDKSVHAINGNIMNSSKDEVLQKKLDQADIILDISTSIAVARHIALDLSSNGRRISMFMNPMGYDLVILAEDKERNSTLDYIEMLYYLKLSQEPEKYKYHLQGVNKVRYSNSCRDISNTIPEDLVSLQSAICSRALQQISNENEGAIQIWKVDPKTFSVEHSSYSLEVMIKYQIGEWTICTSNNLINRTYELRAEKLPNETGGVLIGSFDMQQKIVYILDTLLSPPDSREWPTLYIRGFQGLRNKLKDIDTLTGGNLEYIGEWHSHPAGYGCLPSNDDRRAFSWLETYMLPEGKPALMMIAGDYQQFAFYVGAIT